MARLLIVDDTFDTCDMLTRLFQRCGHSVQCVLDGAKVLPLMRTVQFDLVLLDVMMPGVDGFEVLEAIRSELPAPPIPVAMYSAISDPKEQERAIAMGANEWIIKGTPFSLLRQRLECFLGHLPASEPPHTC